MKLTEQSKVFLSELRISPRFHSLVKELQDARPVVPAYKPGQSQEETISLLERIKFESGRKEGFDLVMLLLTGDRE